MSYVIAFEDDGTARDVTRRYVRAYNAKTRKNRVEVTKGGERWWLRVLKLFDRPFDLDRDQVEDAELAAKEAAEEMPRNVQDFKDHPYYALERHLRRNEVIDPKREVGKVAAGKAGGMSGNKALESIYRRRDVHMVKSAGSWYRLGREIKPAEQPLKRVQPRHGREPRLDDDGEVLDDHEEGAGTGLYAAFQTVTFEAPPVVNGRIPRNEYGNLDIYVRTMVPKGGIHIMDPETARAAQILGIDYANAVTGFEFKGRRGTAVIKGAVVAAEYGEAVEAVINGLESQRAEAEELRRSHEAFRMWKKFMVGLRIRERIEGYDVEGERDVEKEDSDRVDEEMEDDEDGGGGFLPARDEGIAEPTVGQLYQPYPIGLNDEGADFLSESPFEGSEYIPATEGGHTTRDVIGQGEDVEAAGFLADAIDEDAEEALRTAEWTDVQHDIGELSPKEPAERDDEKESSRSEEKEQAGGLIVDEDSANNDNALPLASSLHQRGPGLGLTDQELAEATMLQRMHESTGENAVNAEKQENRGKLPVQELEDMPIDAADPEIHEQQQPAAEDDVPVPEMQEYDDDEEDRGSLMSHDPEDEDAEPDWLASD